MQQRRKTSTTTTATTNGSNKHWLTSTGEKEFAPTTPSKLKGTVNGKQQQPLGYKRDLLDRSGKKRKKTLSIMQRIQIQMQSSQRVSLAMAYGVLAASALLMGAFVWLYYFCPREAPLYRSRQEQDDRRLRFPSVEERVRLYMSNWYVPPCPHSTEAMIHYAVKNLPSEDDLVPPMLAHVRKNHKVYVNNSTDAPQEKKIQQVLVQELGGLHPHREGVYVMQDEILYAQILYLTPRGTIDCDDFTNNEYCPDLVETLLPALKRIDQTGDVVPGYITDHTIPIMTQMGDSGVLRGYNPVATKWDAFPSFPIIMKYRFRFEDPDALNAMTAGDCVSGDRPIYYTQDTVYAPKYKDYYQPIVWKVTSSRHFGMIPKIPELDMPYDEKKDMAVFRGALTGVHRDGYTVDMKGKISDHEKCLLIHRCKLVYKAAGSALVDAKLVTAKVNENAGIAEEIPEYIGDVQIYGKKFHYEQMLAYKAIVMLEGNDISSGFKWALYSNSVVLAQPPTKTSWAMEELLEPWVHYVPLNYDLSDIEERMQWVLQNPNKAKEIARAGSLWIRDLMFHPDAQTDDEQIYDEMVRRYRAHFVYKPALEQIQVKKMSSADGSSAEQEEEES